MIAFFLLVFGVYFVIVIVLIVGWQMALEKRASDHIHFYRIAVVVPFRNEEQHLKKLLDGLCQQDYPADKMELILVNDHSDDRSVEIVNSFLMGSHSIRVVHLSEQLAGKKRALALGIETSSADIIVTTDADCIVSPTWISMINDSFQHPSHEMVVGAVKINSQSSLFSKIQTMEFASVIGSGAATLGFGLPTMCNGANLAFRKSAYDAVDGYEGNFNIASGDDEFLMRKIAEKYPGKIAFLAEAESVVATEPQSTISAFLQQRIRWAGKWKSNSSNATQALAIYIFIFQLSYLAVGLFMIFRIIPSSIFFLLVGTKWLLEFLFLFQICHFLKVRWHWSSFFLLQFLYPFYVCWVALMAQGKPVIWKGRKSSVK